jgi:dsDNA-specific endonuclease/ATPase MutS2
MAEGPSRDEHRDLQQRVDRLETDQAENRKLHLEIAEGQGRIEAGITSLNDLTKRIVDSIQRDVQNLAEKHREDVAEINERITRHVDERKQDVKELRASVGRIEKEMSDTVRKVLTWLIVGVGVPIIGLIFEQVILHVFK